MTIVAFVPAKSRSERIADKNLRILDGDHLFRRKIGQALDCASIDEVCLDTDSDALADLASHLGVSRLERPPELSCNATDGHELFAWQCRQRPDADYWVQLLCTAPFVSAATIERAIDALRANPDADSLVAVAQTKQYAWFDGAPAYGEGRIPNSVDLPPSIMEAMSLYIVRRAADGTLPQRRFGRRPILFPLDPIEQVDINLPADFEIAETIAAGIRSREVTRLRAMRPHLSSSVLADICKDMGIAGILPPALRPTSGGKLLGRAKTLQLAALVPGGPPDAWRGIYGALQCYRFVRAGDVIMVATDIPAKAYFGDLNANLAIRAGAVGAVIDGTTRDTADVRALGFPVYARTSHGDDIKYEGTLQSIGAPVMMGGVPVNNDDMVFADEDGVVVVPRKRWPEVEEAAWDVMNTEARIRILAAKGTPVEDILAECGAF